MKKRTLDSESISEERKQMILQKFKEDNMSLERVRALVEQSRDAEDFNRRYQEALNNQLQTIDLKELEAIVKEQCELEDRESPSP